MQGLNKGREERAGDVKVITTAKPMSKKRVNAWGMIEDAGEFLLEKSSESRA
jgi:hypothetical protein